MKILRSGILACAVAALVCEAAPANGAESAQDTAKAATAAKGKQARKSAEGDTNGTSETYKDVKLEAGKSLSFDSTIDFSNLGRVAVTIRSDGGGDGANDLGKVTVKAYWSVPDADYYAATEVRSGAEFPYTTTGGFIFQTYGSQFRLILKNEGETDIAIQQIIVFGRSL